MRTCLQGFPTRSDTNQTIQPQKVARGLKFWILDLEFFYYHFCENKGADQLRSDHVGDLRLCFCISKNKV